MAWWGIGGEFILQGFGKSFPPRQKIYILPSHTECAKILEPFAQFCYVARECVEFARIISNLCSKILRKYFCTILQKKILVFFFQAFNAHKFDAQSAHIAKLRQHCAKSYTRRKLGFCAAFCVVFAQKMALM